MTLKQFTCAIASLGIMLTNTIATAAPIQQSRICRGFTAGKYKVAANLVTVKLFKSNDNGDYINWSVPKYGSRGYCFVTKAGATSQFVVEKGPQPGAAIGNAVAANVGFSRVFTGIPGYNRGVRAKLSDYYDRPNEQRRYFTVKLEANNARPIWSADCRTEDQIYDAKRIYLGYDPDARALLKLACALGASPVMKPQPR